MGVSASCTLIFMEFARAHEPHPTGYCRIQIMKMPHGEGIRFGSQSTVQSWYCAACSHLRWSVGTQRPSSWNPKPYTRCNSSLLILRDRIGNSSLSTGSEASSAQRGPEESMPVQMVLGQPRLVQGFLHLGRVLACLIVLCWLCVRERELVLLLGF